MFDIYKDHLPISFSMALAHNTLALNAFLSMENAEQDRIIAEAQGVKSTREMQMFVENIGNVKNK